MTDAIITLGISCALVWLAGMSCVITTRLNDRRPPKE